MTTPSDVIVVISGIQYKLVPAETTPTEPIDIKEKIKQQFSSSNVNSLKKVIKGEVKKVQLRNGSIADRMIFTLDDNSIVGFNYASTFYFVNKETKNISIESYGDKESNFKENKMFDTYDVYIDVNKENNVYHPNNIVSGGSRKKHRKSAKRVKYTKKSSQTRMRK